VNDRNESLRTLTRRHFFRQSGFGIGGMALLSLLDERLFAAAVAGEAAAPNPLGPRPPHFAP
jgi:hypothetical protein